MVKCRRNAQQQFSVAFGSEMMRGEQKTLTGRTHEERVAHHGAAVHTCARGPLRRGRPDLFGLPSVRQRLARLGVGATHPRCIAEGVDEVLGGERSEVLVGAVRTADDAPQPSHSPRPQRCWANRRGSQKPTGCCQSVNRRTNSETLQKDCGGLEVERSVETSLKTKMKQRQCLRLTTLLFYARR